MLCLSDPIGRISETAILELESSERSELQRLALEVRELQHALRNPVYLYCGTVSIEVWLLPPELMLQSFMLK
jgi:hypothetical protein